MSGAYGEQPTRGPRAEPERAELEALLARCAAREPAALESLYSAVAPLLLAVLLRMLKRRDLAEDVLQDVFIKVWQQAGQFDASRGSPLAWLISMARYRAIDLQRTVRPAVAITDANVALEPQLHVGGPGDASEVLGGGALLLRCLEQIATPQRNCLVLAYQDGLSHSEIARAVGEPLGTVKSWVRRSLQALRRCLGS